MSYSVIIYCPDRHLVYDGRTPEYKGVGGGVTARLRLAQALALRGNRVSIVGNVPEHHTYRGVTYRPLDEVKKIESDVLILNSTGGSLDLTPILELKVSSGLVDVWVNGWSRLKGLTEVEFDYLVTPSNFVRRIVHSEWQVSPDKTFVLYNGVPSYRRRVRLLPGPRRDPYRLVYTSHPSKGLEAAVRILRLLRVEDSRFKLNIYGGNQLWGESEQHPQDEPGVIYYGLTGQRRLTRVLQRAGFSLNFQSRPEPFGISLVESMAAGAVVLASPVGAYPEIVRDGYDGFLVEGDHLDSETHVRAASLILNLTRNADVLSYVRRNAVCAPLDWDTIARAWEGHWAWALNRSTKYANRNFDSVFWGECVECRGSQLALADGYHCIECGQYSRAGQV